MGLPFIPDDAPFETRVTAYLTEIHTKMEQLMGNGQPGIIHKFHERITKLESSSEYHRGRRSAVSALIAAVTSFVMLLLVELAKAFVVKK